MKTRSFISILGLVLFTVLQASAQKVYTITDGDMIFSWANLEFTNEFTNAFPLAAIENTPPRFTIFFHAGQYLHIDFNENNGIFTGLSLRNIGFTSNEVLPITPTAGNSSSDYQNYKIVRRMYTIGIPVALKLGSFSKNTYVFGGGEMEFGFHMKEKWWDSHDRQGTKSKVTKWFPDNMETFVPSLFGGVQFPKGLNVKFRYYMSDFINRGFNGNGSPIDLSNLTRYETSQVMSISLTWQLLEDFKFRGFDDYEYDRGKVL